MQTRTRLVAMVSVLCIAFLISQFYRASIGVLSPTFTTEMGLSAASLGLLGGTYFIVFALAQIPCGVLLDHYGPRLVNTILLTVAAAGAVVFATSDGPTMLIVGRGIIGLGCATCFMGALVIFSRWFPPRHFPIMAAVAGGIGGGGALLATTPLAIVVTWVGWRSTFLIVSVLTVFTATIVWLLVRDAPEERQIHTTSANSFSSTVRGVRTVALNRQLQLLLPLNTVAYGSIMVVLGLWGTPYLRDVHGMDTVAAANLLMAMALSSMAGGLAYAWLAPRLGSIKYLVLCGSVGTASIFIVLAVLPPTSQHILLVLFALHGFIGAYPVLIVSHVRMIVPKDLMGRGLTLSNLFSFGGVGLLQLTSGWIIGFFSVIEGARVSIAYTTLFLCVALISGLAVWVYTWIRDPDLTTPEAS